MTLSKKILIEISICPPNEAVEYGLIDLVLDKKPIKI